MEDGICCDMWGMRRMDRLDVEVVECDKGIRVVLDLLSRGDLLEDDIEILRRSERCKREEIQKILDDLYELIYTLGTDLAKITKKWPKPNKIEHEIEKIAQKPDPKTVMCLLRGGFCLFCDSKAENSYTCDPNAYSFNDTSSNFNHLPQPQFETYLFKLCRNNSHYGYDCQSKFPFVYDQESSCNQNYNDNYYPHELPSCLCYNNCGGSHETLQCQPIDQNIDSFSFDQIQPSQSLIIHHPSQEMSEEVFQAKGNLMKSIQTFLEKFSRYPFGVMPKNHPTFYDDEEHYVQYKEYLKNCSNAIAPVLPTKEPEYSLSMGYEHLNTTLETESDKVIKSSVKKLVPIPREYEVTSNDENTLIDSSPKFDFLHKEFSGELTHINPIIPGIEEADFELEEEIRLDENLLYDNSSPRPSKELNAKIADTIVESLSPSPIYAEDSDSLMEEINLFLATDDLMPPGIESDDYDSEGDIYFLEGLLVDDSIPLPENESSNFDHHDHPLFPRPPLKPPDVEIFFDFEPDLGELISAL
uniref:Reverse transcriptase domain-containing protein n=1 Tax=Tanacetum cinerariifolium TaxID=118510 RepID=A0A6L2JV14_TANCI|nr:hypothetical protein [Tanacetum cinerariifolium]